MPSLPPWWRRVIREEIDATAALRDLGVDIDRSNLLLRPRHGSDETALVTLSQRPTGAAHATVLELSSLVETCLAAGTAALPAAIGRTAGLLRQAAATVRHGQPTEVWLLGPGDLQPVERTFDFATEWSRRVAAPLRRELPLHLTPGQASIWPRSRAALERALDALTNRPFSAFGDVVERGPDIVRLQAGRGIAFGPRHVVARGPVGDESIPVALLPRALRAEELELDLHTLMARFWMRAAEHMTTTATAPDGSPTAAPSLEGAPGPITSPPAADAPDAVQPESERTR